MKSKHLFKAVWVALLGFALCAGLYGRFYALGSRPLAVDEYYFVSSVHLILEKGVPEYDLGGYYARSAPLQYLTAASVLALGDNGLAYRLLPALLSLLAVALAYGLCRCFLGKLESLAVAAALMVSAWEIEFARFARMYVPLQCVTLGFLILLQRRLAETGQGRPIYGLCGLALLAVVIHPLAIALLPMLFFPLLQEHLKGAAGRLSNLIRGAVVPALTSAAALAYALLEPKLDRWGVADALPQGLAVPGRRLIEPAFPFLGLEAAGIVAWILLPGLLVLAAATLSAEALDTPAWRNRTRITLLGLLLLAAALHQFVFAALILAVLHLRLETFQRSVMKQPAIMALLAACGGAAAFWITFALARPASLLQAAPSDWPKAFRLTFLGWPDFYQPFAEPWLRSLPLLAMLLGLSLLWLAFVHLKGPAQMAFSSPALPLISFLLLIGILESTYDTTRYSFFLYPLVLCLIMIALRDLLRRYGPARMRLFAPGAFLALFALSGDFQPGQAFGVATDAVSYRTGEYERFKDHWFRRDELRTPADFLNSRTDPAQPLVVSAAEHEMPIYLKRPFALYFPTERLEFRVLARRKGSRDKWSGARLLTSHSQLRSYVGGSRTVWLTRRAEAWNRPFEISQVWGAELDSWQIAHTSRDGRIEVVKVTLRSERGSGDRRPSRPQRSEAAAGQAQEPL